MRSAEPAPAPRASGAPGGRAAAPYRVMVVDDSAVIRGLLTRSLEADPEVAVLASAGNGEMALTALQRRLASSPEAIFQSLKRRRERLERRLREEKLGIRGQQALADLPPSLVPPEDDDDQTAEEQENMEETLVDEASAARTIADQTLRLTRLGELWNDISQSSQAAVQKSVEGISPFLWNGVLKVILNQPAWAVMGILGILLLLIFRPARPLIGYSR